MTPNPNYFDNGPIDDEDLINDYIEDEGPPLDDYDDAYLEEMMEEQDRGGVKKKKEQGEEEEEEEKKDPHECSEAKKNRNNDLAHAVNGLQKDNDGDIIMGDAVNENIFDVPTEVTVDQPNRKEVPNSSSLSALHGHKENKLYSFERYNSKKFEWRQKSSRMKREEQDVMTATQWRKKVKDQEKREKSNKRNDNRTNNPESQLVHFMSTATTSGSGGNALLSTYGQSRFEVKSHLPVANEKSQPLTIDGDKMVYVPKVKEDMRYIRCNGSSTKTDDEESNLLGIPLSELLRRTEVIERRNMRRKRIRTENSLNGADEGIDNDDGVHNEDRIDDGQEENTMMGKKRATNNSQLWVDKHAPKYFTDLLSDERANREVLRALREWDPFVFKKEPPKRPQIYSQNKYQNENNPINTSTNEISGDMKTKINDLRPDEQNRVILLSGPPGVGKTTLAHIVARHAGYRPLEVNASDERSASVLIDRISSAMESTTLTLKMHNTDKTNDMNGRPNCLILDEIDGADAKSSLAAIVEIIRAERPIKGGSKKGLKKTYLRRPIIFICNHKYAPALRPLLPYARQFDIQPPPPHRLISRLKAVLNKERMTLVGGGSNLLRQLVSSTGGDIRSCLYTLQFASARAREIHFKARNLKTQNRGSMKTIVDISPVLNIALNGNGRGMKDIRADIAGTLRTVFRKMKLKKQDQIQYSHSSKDIERILSTVETFSDPSKTLDGLFLNLMNVSYIDPTLDRCWTAHEWLSSCDLYRSQNISVASTNHTEHRMMQNFHIPSAAAAVHVLCRVESNAELTFSLRPLLDSNYQFEVNCGLVNKFFEGLCPKLRCAVSMYSFTADVLPFCLNLLSAGVGDGALNRAVSTVDILTDEEKVSFEVHVQLLQHLGLTYKKVEGQVEQKTNSVKLRLEPEIDQISQFKGIKKSKSKRNDVPSELKELIAHAASIASMKEKEKRDSSDSKEVIETKTLESIDSKSKPPADTPQSMQPAVNDTSKSLKSKKSVPAMNFLGIGAARAKAARSARKASLVGFNKAKKQKKMSNTGSEVPLDEVIRFKYQKGFTQAVRLPCSMNDFTFL